MRTVRVFLSVFTLTLFACLSRSCSQPRDGRDDTLSVSKEVASSEVASRQLTCSRLRLKGGRRVLFQFPQPMCLYDDYEDVAVLAFPIHSSMETDPVRIREVRKLSRHLDGKGNFHWRIPPGEWMILRIGSTPSCTDPEGRPSSGGVLPTIPWRQGLARQFRRAVGYDPLPWLSVMGGYIVENKLSTHAFLSDLNRIHDARKLGEPRYRHILLRDFRTVKDGKVINYNIGTAAHGPSTMAVLKKYLPDNVRITVWAHAPLEASFARMMRRRFPDTEWVYGSLSDSDPDTSSLARAVAESDLFLVSSGSGISVAPSLRDYKRKTGKASAAYAIGYGTAQDDMQREMDFIWFRDEPSLASARRRKAVPPVSGWAPDAVFDFDCVDEEGAIAFMKEGGLEPGRFICCIPGFRFTPRWEYFGTPVDEDRRAVNEASQKEDNEILCRIIIETVRKRGLKVLICAEQIPELRLCREAVYDQLPDDVRQQCVLQQEWWSPDVALGVYLQSLCVCGIEMHSQVMAAGNGIPAVVFRHSGFGSKSDMWNTIGLGDWLLDIDSPDAPERSCQIVGSILDNPTEAFWKLENARRIIDSAEREAIFSSFFK